MGDPRPARDRRQAYDRGLEAEDEAAALMERLGFTEIARRAKMPGGELDLIVEDAETLVFVEVKARATQADGLEAVSPRQQARIRSGLLAWLAKHDEDGQRAATKSIRCDVVVVAPGTEPLHIPNAFPAQPGDF
ncbi:MAG: YraN family protein [Pseudomonadota bacterium]